MSLGLLSFENISEGDLRSLIDNGVAEDLLIEYKRDVYGNNDEAARDFLKDVSSFANTVGGHLIIGMNEAEGLPTAITPLTIDADAEIQRLESKMREGINPRISGVRIRAVPVSGGTAIVIRIPRSWNPPHEAKFKTTRRYYARNSNGASELSVDELRVLFNRAATAGDRARAFRQERIAKISGGDTPALLTNARGKLILHIVPLSAFGLQGGVHPTRVFEFRNSFWPMDVNGFSPTYNFDGFLNIDGKGQGYTQIFRNGCVETVRVGQVGESYGEPTIFPADIERRVVQRLHPYLSALQSLDIPPPLVVMITLEGIGGASLLRIRPRLSPDVASPRLPPVLELPEIVIDDYGSREHYARAIRPACDALWNAGGQSESRSFCADGTWKGPW